MSMLKAGVLSGLCTLSSDISGDARRMPPATYSVVLMARSFQS